MKIKKKLIDKIKRFNEDKLKKESSTHHNIIFQSMTTEPQSQCMTCKNELSDGKCTAYPKSIPMDIWTAKRNDCKLYTSLEEG